MFILQAKEILEAVPTAKFDEKSAQKLLRSIEEEEEQMLEPLMGESLMQLLYAQYKAIYAKYGGIYNAVLNTADMTTASGMMENVSYTDPVSYETVTIAPLVQKRVVQLMRVVQCALVYRMLSNKIYSLSTSLNLGGGANRASAGDYEPADDKHLQEVRKEYYMNSRKACDGILVLLERDAKMTKPGVEEGSVVSDSLWLTLWKESDGYFLKEDLLFPTLRSLKPYYPCNEPTRFLGLAPVIRYCQDTYINPRVDDSLLDKLTCIDSYLSLSEKKTLKLLRMALAYYVRAKEGSRDERNEALMTADSAMSTALAYIESLKTQPTETDGTNTAQTPADQNCGHQKCSGTNGDSEYDTFCTLFNPALNRW